MAKYKFYTDNNKEVIVVSTYARKNVRGVARCNPQDDFNYEIGKQIAKARCDLKIAEKRVKRARARERYDAATEAFNKATVEVNKATKYLLSAEKVSVDASKELEKCGELVRN